MKKLIKNTIFIFLSLNLFNISISDENFYDKGLKFYDDKKYNDAKFMFEKSIVFNPKDSNSYLYLAKIYNHKKDQKKEEKNLDATLLIDPNNEEAILMLMKIGLEKSNFSKVKDLSKTFEKVCKKLCDENQEVIKMLENLEPKNDS
jgi:tetratricopeptide (TPR) repeat protein|tara:strand:+ start:665 stop:1102 length:438 start_codon:yes stop_codon:yes gene_type:complete